MAGNRDAFLYMFLGHNRTGKSVTAEKVAQEYVKHHPDNAVIAYDPQSRFKAITDERIIGEADWQRYVDEGYYDCLFIVDDYHMLVDERIDKGLLKLLAYRNERGIDMIFITHNPELIRKKISYYITHLFLYYTQGTDNDFKGKLNNSSQVIQARHYINTYVESMGRETYRSRYPDFPYIYIDCQEGQVHLININPA